MIARLHLALVLLVLSGAAPVSAAPDRQDVSTLSTTEITALQRRLTDAGCYRGPLDGRPSEATKQAVAACPDQRPRLRIETGMHVAVINRIGVDAGCSLAATASDDKTVRLWSLPEGKLLRTLRWPIGAGNGGKVYATAVSPDGRFVAAGGSDAGYEVSSTHSVTVFDAASGAVVARAGAFESAILHLAFSPDGRWLAATLGRGGVRMIETATWRQIAEDKAYGGSSYGATFGPDGRLYTVADDGKLRRYASGPGFGLEQTIATRGGKEPYSVAIDPSGARLVVGYSDTTAVDFYDAKTLRPIGQADTKGIDNGHLGSVAWRADGQAVIAGGQYDDGTGKFPTLLFSRAGRHLAGPPPAKAEDTIFDLQPCGDGFAVAAYDPAFGLLDPSGQARFWRTGVAADMRGKLGDSAFLVSADAKTVRFGLGPFDKNPVLFDVARASLVESPGLPAGLAAPDVAGLPVTDWTDNRAPRLGGAPLALYQYETPRSLAIQPDRSGFVLGTEYRLRAFDAKGGARWEKAVPGAAWGVNLSADGRIIVAAYGDGTIRWHRWSDGQELLALFVNKLTKAWVAWTPTGYYSASPGGEDMIGWHVNRGWDQAADFFPASRFHDQFARPDIIEHVLDTLDEAEAVKQANAARGGKAPETGSILDHLPPVISILSPADGANVGEELRLDYSIRSPSGLAVDSVEALIDGRPVSTGRGLGRLDDSETVARCLTETRGLGRVEGALQGCRGSLTIKLPPGISEIGLFARAGRLSSEAAKIRVTRANAASPAELLKPKLYAFVIGVSAYADPDYNLGFAAKDATDFATALRNQKGGLYSEVDVHLLTDAKATTRNILEGLDWLTHAVTSRDVGVLYFAGHGKLDENTRLYLLANDSDVAHLRSTAISREEITAALDAITGKAVLLFLDACHSGAVTGDRRQRGDLDMNAIVNDFSRGEHGVVVFASSTGRQVSQENPAWNNGAFTKAVVEGLGLPGAKAMAALGGDGKITTSGLDRYVTERVKKLTDGQQSPVMSRAVPDFTFAVAR